MVPTCPLLGEGSGLLTEGFSVPMDGIKMIKSWPTLRSLEGAPILVSLSPTSSWLPTGCDRGGHWLHEFLQHMKTDSQSGVPWGSPAFWGAGC